MHRILLGSAFSFLALAAGTSTRAHAQDMPNQGFQLNRYEPTAAGEWSFAVDHPWYSSTRSFAAGITLNYAHNPLALGSVDDSGGFSTYRVLVAHQMLAHLDVAGSFLDRVLLTASLPIVLTTSGEPRFESGASLGDPRLGGRVRLFGQPYKGAVALSIGLDLWIPLRAISDGFPPTSGDQSVRALPKLIAGGVWNKLLWSGTLGFLIRPEAVTVAPADLRADLGRAASELQLGLAAAYYDVDRRFAIGPELLIATAATGKDSFSRYGTSVEAMLAGHYNIKNLVQAGLALGAGFVRQPGTPDFRALLRLAYAPTKERLPDRDQDGIVDRDDACPEVKGLRSEDPRMHGCPLPVDRDRDGIPDLADLCPDVHQSPTPDPARIGCPAQPPPRALDRDGDGVLDSDDICPDLHKGASPDPARLGCPQPDLDKDGIPEPHDQCPSEPIGLVPDPAHPGCPLKDRDKDSVPDATDACPDKPGAPHPDPVKHGCPGLIEVKNGQLVILRPVYFALDKDVILPASFPVLQAVADALRVTPSLTRIRIEGHTDSQGVHIYNIDLSQRRAKSVRTWLIQHGIAELRLLAEGFGPDRPLVPNTTPAGRAKNRRVEFHIVEGTGGTAIQP